MATTGRARRLILRTAIALAALVIVLAAAVKYVVGPHLVAAALQQRLAGLWEGQAHAGGVEFSFASPLHVARITLTDNAGRQWLRLDRVTLDLANWPGTSPTLTAMAAEEARLTVFVDSGRCHPPLGERPPPAAGPQAPAAMRMESVRIRDVTLAMESCGRRIDWAGVGFSLQRQGDVYQLRVQRQSGDDRLDLAGTVDPNLRFDLALAVRHRIVEDEGRELAAVLNFPLEFRASGDLDANIAAQGVGADLKLLRAGGDLSVRHATILNTHGVLASDANAQFAVGGDGGLKLDSRSIAATLCGGQITGRFSAALTDGKAEPNFAYWGDMAVRGVHLPELVRVLGSRGQMESGELRTTFSFGGGSFKTADFRGRGAVLLRQADLRSLDLGREVFVNMGIDANIIVGGSRLRGDFAMQGTRVRVDKARLANNVSALDVEPGGLVDLQKQTVDFYVVGAPLWQLRDLITALPVVGAFSKVADKITRVRVKGSWNDPPDKLVSKLPANDIGEGTLEFFRAAVTTAGAGELLKALGSLLPGLGGEADEP